MQPQLNGWQKIPSKKKWKMESKKYEGTCFPNYMNEIPALKCKSRSISSQKKMIFLYALVALAIWSKTIANATPTEWLAKISKLKEMENGV